MNMCQEPKIEKNVAKVTVWERAAALAVLAAVVGFFVFMWLGDRGAVDMRGVFGICGFKQEHGLPCPGCGMTKAAMAFAGGRIFEAFYVQPAAGVFCCGFVAAGVVALLVGGVGVNLPFLREPVGTIAKYVLVAAVIVVAVAATSWPAIGSPSGIGFDGGSAR